ncbi:MAG: hypothetical protein ACK4ZJ_19590, partial [Allorhizobium sp.]
MLLQVLDQNHDNGISMQELLALLQPTVGAAAAGAPADDPAVARLLQRLRASLRAATRALAPTKRAEEAFKMAG